MILGRVVGHVWATKKHPRLGGLKLLLVRPHCWYEPAHQVDHLVAVDPSLDAGPGDEVVVCMGDPPRTQSGGRDVPVEAAIMAVVDRCEIDESALRGARPLSFIGGGPSCLVVGRIRTEPMAERGEGC